jgi:hypothetical protein
MMIRSPVIESEELDTLHREYRNMEANRKAYAEESAAVSLWITVNIVI